MLFDFWSDQSTTLVRDWNALCCAAIAKEHLDAEDRLLSGKPVQAFLHSSPFGHSSSQLQAHFNACHAEIDVSSILYIVAGVEARIRADAMGRARRCVDPLERALARLHNQRDAPWQVPFREGILDAWKIYARTQLTQGRDVNGCIHTIGAFATALDIRHWIAHGRGWNINRPVTGRAVAHAALSSDRLVASLRQLAQLGQLAPFV